MVYVYFIREITNKKKKRYGAIKIGIAGNIAKRLEGLQTSNPRELELILAIPFDTRYQALLAEKKLHRSYRSFRIRGEWFRNCINFSRLINMSLDIEDEEKDIPDENCNIIQAEKHFQSI